MFSFIGVVFSKIASALTAVLVAIGLTSASVQPQTPIVGKDQSSSPIVQEIKKPATVTQTPTQPKQSKTFTTPSGAVVNETGDLIKAPTQSSNYNSSQFSIHKTLDITSHSLTSSLQDAKTNVRLISIHFLAGGDTEATISGIPTQLAHSATDTHIKDIRITVGGSASLSVLKSLRILANDGMVISGDYVPSANGEVVFSAAITVPSGESRDYVIAADVAGHNFADQNKDIHISLTSVDADSEIRSLFPISNGPYLIASSPALSIQRMDYTFHDSQWTDKYLNITMYTTSPIDVGKSSVVIKTKDGVFKLPDVVDSEGHHILEWKALSGTGEWGTYKVFFKDTEHSQFYSTYNSPSIVFDLVDLAGNHYVRSIDMGLPDTPGNAWISYPIEQLQ